MRLFFGLLLALSLAGQQPAEKPGRVSGKVFNALTGEPVRKANVTLQPAGAQPQMPQGPMAMMRGGMSAATDTTGAFALDNVTPGTYRITADKAGFIRTTFGNRAGNVGSQIVVASGSDKADINIRILPHGVVSGRIVDEDGDPLEGVAVSLYRPNTNRTPQRGGQTAAFLGFGMNQTNDRGEFRIPNVSPGKYYVLVQRVGFGSGAVQMGGLDYGFPRLFFPGVETISQAQRIEVSAGQEFSGVQMTLRRTRVFRVRGTVSGMEAPAEGPANRARRGPMGGMTIQLRLEGGYNEDPGPRGRAGAGMVQPDGNFEIAGVTPGAYKLVLSTMAQGGPRVVASTSVNVGNNNVDGIVLSPSPLATLAGKITVEGDASLVNFKSIRIQVQPELGFNQPVTPGEDGTFLLKNLSLERQRVNIPAIPSAYVKAIKIGGQPIPASGVDLSGGGVGEIEIILSTKVASLAGRVEKQQQDDAPGTVVITDPELKPLNLNARVEDSGNFTIANLPPGTFKVFAFEEYDGNDPDLLEKFASRAENVKIGEGESKTVNLRQIRYSEMASAPR